MKKILLIDDDKSIARIMEFQLLRAGYLVLKSFSGTEALEALRESGSADLIILDLKLPDINGLELMEVIRGYTEVPIIINSGYSQYKSDFNSWLADDYLIKDMDLSELRNRIRLLLDRAADRF